MPHLTGISFLLSRMRIAAAVSLIALTSVGLGHGVRAASPTAPVVRIVRTPAGGIQPQASVDAHGILHLLYFQGDAAHGNLFYVHRPIAAADGTPFSDPIRVNSERDSAMSIGTIRGGQLAIGPDGAVTVVWNGSSVAAAVTGGAPPFLFSRLQPGATVFEPERDLLSDTEIIDGGGSVAINPKSGDVYAFWHSVNKGGNESIGNVYERTISATTGQLSAIRRVSVSPTGTCGCCGMRAIAGADGAVLCPVPGGG